MKKIHFLVAFIVSSLGLAHAQDSIPKPWTKGGQGGITFNQVALSNWAAGGQSSITLIGNLNLFANRKVEAMTWDNSLDLAYGFLKNNFIYDPKRPITKAEDRIELNSKYGTKAWSDKFYYSGLATFRTQFARGFANPGDASYISRALSPAYLNLAMGLDYKPADWLSFLVSPVSGKMTIVADDSLANSGAFGVNTRDAETGRFRPGSYQHLRMEFGATMRAKFKKDIMKNVGLESNLELFSNYIDRPQNIDVRSTNALVAKINQYIVVNLFIDMIYDNDILIPQVDPKGLPVFVPGTSIQQTEPRLQLKQVFGLGFSYKF
ncbi:MAG: hypothetical protein RLZZ165_597 [Bacteroidota bacterium]|jgi:hypothetical protein